MELDDVAEELYAVPPGEFIDLRDERATQAKTGGNRQLATAIGKLRRPTQAAWLVNLLVREHPDELEALLGLGDALRQAQQRLSGDELRQLSTQRHKVVNAMARKAVVAAGDRGQKASPAAIEEVRQTLQAALADPATGDRVRGGRMLASAEYSGFGPPRLTVVRSPEPAPKRPAKPARPAEPKPDAALIAKAQKAYDAAAKELATATDAATTARADADGADKAATTAADLVQRLRTELRDAERDEQSTHRTRDSARRLAKSAERDRDKVERRADEAQFALDRAKKGHG